MRESFIMILKNILSPIRHKGTDIVDVSLISSPDTKTSLLTLTSVSFTVYGGAISQTCLRRYCSTVLSAVVLAWLLVSNLVRHLVCI